MQYFINETNYRICLATRKGLMDLIRERFGVRTSLFFGGLILLCNLFLATSLFLLLKEMVVYLSFPPLYYYIYISMFLLTPVFFKKLKSIRKLFIVNSIFLFPLFTFILLGKINLAKLATPLIPFDIFQLDIYPALAALFGLSFPVWTHFFIGGYVSTNNINIHKLEFNKLEQRFVLLLSGIFQFLILLSFVGVLSVYSQGPPYPSFMGIIYDVFPTILKMRSIPTILIVFSCAFGIIFISLSSSHIFGNFFGVEALPDQEISHQRGIKYLYLLSLICSFLLASFIKMRTIFFILFAGIFNFGLLLFLLYYLYTIGNTRGLMGRFKNSGFSNGSIVITSVVILFILVMIIWNCVSKCL